MQKKAICLSLLTAVTFMHPCNSDAVNTSLKKAAAKQIKREYRKERNGQGALTKEMITDCIRMKGDVDSSYAAIGTAKKEFDDLEKRIKDLGAYLKKIKPEVDKGNKRMRAEYDRKVREYNSSLPGLDQQLEKHRQTISTYERKSNKFDRECNGQPYYEDDYAEVVKKMGRSL